MKHSVMSIVLSFSDTVCALANRGTLAALVYKFIFIEPEEDAAPINEGEGSQGDFEQTAIEPIADEGA